MRIPTIYSESAHSVSLSMDIGSFAFVTSAVSMVHVIDEEHGNLVQLRVHNLVFVAWDDLLGSLVPGIDKET